MGDLAALAAFLPRLESPDFSPGGFSEMRKEADGTLILPYWIPSETASDFIRMAYDTGWVWPDFDWVKWARTEEATRLHENEGAMASATEEQLAKLLTALIRQDRFVEGAMNAAFQSGLILHLVKRAAALNTRLPNH
jgi:hypothetical protein